MDQSGNTNNGTAWNGLQYTPDPVAACIFIAGFGLGTIGHFFQMIKFRAWYFIPFVIGCIMETFGHYGRFWLSQSPQNFKAYVLYDLLCLPAPIFLAATMYMSISRIVVALDASETSPIAPRWLSKLFVLGDIFCFIVQLSGIGMTVTTSTQMQEIGRKVVVGGLVCQILVFGGFIWIASVFFQRYKARKTNVFGMQMHWNRFIVALLAASSAIVLRNVVIGIQHAQGGDGFVAKHEVFPYVFDALPILGVVCVFLVWHPGRLQRRMRGMKGGDIIVMGQGEGLILIEDERRVG